MTDPTTVFGVKSSDIPLWENLVRVYDLTTSLERRRGSKYWLNQWRAARADAETHWHHGTQRRTIQAAGIIAALSQRKGSEHTMELAIECFARKGEVNGDAFEAVRDKVAAIFAGKDPEEVLSGPMVEARFQSIVTKGDTNQVVVDRHMAAMAYGRLLGDRERNQALRQSPSRDGYKAVADAVRYACYWINKRDGVQWRPATFQAVCRVGWTNCLLGEERG